MILTVSRELCLAVKGRELERATALSLGCLLLVKISLLALIFDMVSFIRSAVHVGGCSTCRGLFPVCREVFPQRCSIDSFNPKGVKDNVFSFLSDFSVSNRLMSKRLTQRSYTVDV